MATATTNARLASKGHMPKKYQTVAGTITQQL
jgi:hypothetical protein